MSRNSPWNVSPKPSTWPPGRLAAARPVSFISAGLRSRIWLGSSRWPIQRLSGFSPSHAAAAVDPPISHWMLFLRPGADLADGHRAACPVGEAQQDQRRVLRGHLARDRVRRSAPWRTSRPGPRGCWRTFTNVVRSANTAVTCRPVMNVTRSIQCEPMSPDRPQRAALLRDQAPVPVGVLEQPVLEVAAGDQPHLAQAAVAHELRRVLVDGVEADVEVDRGDAVRGRGQRDQLRGLRAASPPAASRTRRGGRRPGSP